MQVLQVMEVMQVMSKRSVDPDRSVRAVMQVLQSFFDSYSPIHPFFLQAVANEDLPAVVPVIRDEDQCNSVANKVLIDF